MNSHTISVARNYSRFPAGRNYSDGPVSGERFREEFLVPALRKYDRVVVQLDGVLGYGSSFLEEAFGGLVRQAGFKASELHSILTIETADPGYFKEVWSNIDTATPGEARA